MRSKQLKRQSKSPEIKKANSINNEDTLFSQFQIESSASPEAFKQTRTYLLDNGIENLQSENPPAALYSLNNTISSESEQDEKPTKSQSQEFVDNLISFNDEQERLKFKNNLQTDLDKAKYQGHVTEDIPSALDAKSSTQELFENLLKFQYDVANQNLQSQSGGFFSLEQRTESQELLDNLIEYQKRHAGESANFIQKHDSNASLINNLIDYQSRQQENIDEAAAIAADTSMKTTALDPRDSNHSLVASLVDYQQRMSAVPQDNDLLDESDSQSATKVIVGVHTRASTLASTAKSGGANNRMFTPAPAVGSNSKKQSPSVKTADPPRRSPARSLTTSSASDTEHAQMDDGADSVRVFGILESDLTLDQVIGTQTAALLPSASKNAMAKILKLIQRIQQFSLDIHETIEDIDASNATKIEWTDLQKAVRNLVTFQDFSSLRARVDAYMQSSSSSGQAWQDRVALLETKLADSESARQDALQQVVLLQQTVYARDNDLARVFEKLERLENECASAREIADKASKTASEALKSSQNVPSLPTKTLARSPPRSKSPLQSDTAILNLVDKERLSSVSEKLSHLSHEFRGVNDRLSVLENSASGKLDEKLEHFKTRIEARHLALREQLEAVEAKVDDQAFADQKRSREGSYLSRASIGSRGENSLLMRRALEEKQALLEEQLEDMRVQVERNKQLSKEVGRNSRHLDTLQGKLANLMDQEQDEIGEFRTRIQTLGSRVDQFQKSLELFASQFSKLQTDLVDKLSQHDELQSFVEAQLSGFKGQLQQQEAAQSDAADSLVRLAKLVSEYEALLYRVRDGAVLNETAESITVERITAVEQTERAHGAHQYLDKILDQRLAKFDRTLNAKVDQKVLEELLRHIGTRKELKSWTAEQLKDSASKLRADLTDQLASFKKLLSSTFNSAGGSGLSPQNAAQTMEAFFGYLESECIVPTMVSAGFRDRLNEWIAARIGDYSHEVDDKLSEFKKDMVRLLDLAQDTRQSSATDGIYMKIIETKLRREWKKLLETQRSEIEGHVTDRLRHIREALLVHQKKSAQELQQKLQGLSVAERAELEQRLDDKLGQQRQEDALEVAALASRQLRQDMDEKLAVVCSQFNDVQSQVQQSLEMPWIKYGQWIWKSGVLKFDNAVPWNYETANSDPDNVKWEKDSSIIRIKEAGLYEVTFAFFTASKPSIQLFVNNESVLSAINSSSYVVHHGSGFVVTDGKVQPGQVAGLSLLDFLALPSKSTLSIHYHGNRKQSLGHGFLGLRRLS